MNKSVKVKHPNGYTGILYGESSMVIHDPDGHEVMHTGFRNIHAREQLYDYLGRFPEAWDVIQKMLERGTDGDKGLNQ